MSRSDCLAAAEAYFDSGRFFADLAARVACRTESDTGTVPPALNDYLREQIAVPLARLGFTSNVVANPVAAGGPFLIARRVENAGLPTLLTYGHGDVVSGQAGSWRAGLDPWSLTREGDRWYGRGTADNKGQHTINLGALASAIETRGGRLGYNVTVLLETGEEAGSPGLHEVCRAHSNDLAADVFLACDGPRVHAAQPTLFLGSRGAVNFTLRLRSREKSYHSGNWGGVLANPATVLAHALTTLVDRRGRIRIEALRPAHVPESVRRAL
jgi:acetylornithine deacetylase/succinyl-diaminopimelate desuccinylase-like protein